VGDAPPRVFVALGSNLGDREALLALALRELRASEATRVVAVSPVFETDPVGPPPQGPYLNAVVEVRTGLVPRALLARLLAIEAGAGRERLGARHAARTLDLDLLLYGDLVLEAPGLALPHPRLAERAFVLEPLCALAPGLVHPVLRETVAALAARVRDPTAVRRRDDTLK